jgi:branched-chain amino acid transport system substrate-binding protein
VKHATRTALVGLVIAAVMVAAGCGGGSGNGGSSGGSGGDKALSKVTIVTDLPMTGSARAQTESMVKAVKMKLEEVNYKAGAVPITFKEYDNSTAQAGKWDEAKCTQNMTELATNKDVVVAIGPMNSGCAQVQIKIANQAGLAMISPAATAVGLTKSGGDPGEPDKYYPSGVRNFLRVALSDDLQGKAAAMWAKDLGVKKAFVLHDKETYGKGIADQFQTAAKEQGVEIVGEEGIDPMASNYRALIPKITEAGATLVFFGGITQNNAGQVLKDLRSAAPDVQFIGPDGIFEEAFIEAAGPAADGAHATFGGVPPEKLEGAGKEFVEAFTKKYGKPQAYTAYAYDAAGIAVEAITRCSEAGTVTRGCVLKEMFATKDYSGALGTLSVTETGDTTLTLLSGITVKQGAWEFDRTIDVGAAS